MVGLGMYKKNSHCCNDLIEKTAAALNEDIVALMLSHLISPPGPKATTKDKTSA